MMNKMKKGIQIIKFYLKPFKKRFYTPIREKLHERRKSKELDEVKANLDITHLPQRTILVYPGKLRWANPMWAILYLLNFKITYNPNDDFDMALHWYDTTFKEVNPILLKISQTKPVINLYSTNISKKYLDAVCAEVFGYNTEINPFEFEGAAVKKSNYNFQKNGEIIQCPINEIEENHIYQLLIDSQYDEDYFSEYRVPVFGNKIPFVYDKLILLKERFWGVAKKVLVKDAEEVFTDDEIKKIALLCKKMNIEYCELDIFRDRKTQKIYIVDINDTVGGLQGQKNPDEGKSLYEKGKRNEAIRRLARGFYEAFLSSSPYFSSDNSSKTFAPKDNAKLSTEGIYS